MSLRRKIFLAAGLPAAGLFIWWLIQPEAPGTLASTYVVAWLLVASIWLLRITLRTFLWRVSRRLAFSYFLIGVVPIPLVACLMGLGLYILGGFFMGHVYGDALTSLQSELETAARTELYRLRGRLGGAQSPQAIRFAYYRSGRHIAGDPDAPALLRDVLPRAETGEFPQAHLHGKRQTPPIFADPDGQPTLFAAAEAEAEQIAVVARFNGSLEAELRRRTGLWVEIVRPSERDQEDRVTIHLRGREFPVEALRPQAPKQDIEEFFLEQEADRHSTEDDSRSGANAEVEDSLSVFERPWLVWLELSRPFLDPLSSEDADPYLSATLVSSPAALIHRLLPSDPEVNFFVYLALLAVFLITLNLYIIALLMALMMIFSLSRAVNRLTTATRGIQRGDFRSRIDVFRGDQIGALQAGFNTMAANLERLVDEEAKKEIFERELQIAAQMQQSLLPDTLEAPAPLQFATYFEPSRAIGGDYYDLLQLADGRLAVVIADVAGHGLPAGLRMAMVKSALELLCQDHGSPKTILQRLHELLRERLHQQGRHRAFVSATVAAFDLDNARLEIVGAGHPPTYRLRAGELRPFDLPGPPLGILPPTLPTAHMELEPGDLFLWLSDGLIEATDRQNDAFGYHRIEATLRALPREAQSDPESVKQALLDAVGAHAGASDGGDESRPAVDDDLTVVVAVYKGPEESEPAFEHAG